MPNDIVTKKLATRGLCQVCGSPIEVAEWVAKILDRQGIEPTTCCRAHANTLTGATSYMDDLDESEG